MNFLGGFLSGLCAFWLYVVICRTYGGDTVTHSVRVYGDGHPVKHGIMLSKHTDVTISKRPEDSFIYAPVKKK